MTIADDRTEAAASGPPSDLPRTAPGPQVGFRTPHPPGDSMTRPPTGDEQTLVGEPGSLVAALGPGDIVDRYVIITPIGHGGMGVVYAAYDPDLDRKVALKLLLPQAEGGSHSSGRLLREAQALARLAHPNVVAVHDVGTRGDQVWLAMEFVAGVTLGTWAQAHRRTWPEISRVLADAARGVAAAHAAGLVHRDLKPDNVMIGSDGRVRVMDFGLAHGRAVPSEDVGVTVQSHGALPTGAALAVRLTQLGAIQGTPAYMAPEQWLGEEAQAATDQFGWSVMAWELLYGERPFAGDSRPALAAAVMAGKRRPAPRGRGVPPWLRKLIERGLDPEPARRWPSVAVMLAQLERGQAQARVRTAALVLGGLALVGLAGVAWQRWQHTQQLRACEADGAEIHALWNDDTRAALRAAFTATGLSYAETTAAKIMPWLDAQASALALARTQVCLHSEVEHTWDDDTSERARGCLEDRRVALTALVDELSRTDATIVDKAVTAAADLAAVEPCLDIDVLRRQPAVPVDQREAVQALRAGLVRIDTLYNAAKYARALELATELRTQAEALGWAPLMAAALVREGRLLRQLEPAAAGAPTERAYFMAVGASAWEESARAANLLITMRGKDGAQYTESLRWGRHSEAVIAHAGDPAGLLEATRLASLGAVHQDLGDKAQALPLLQRSLELRERAFGPDHPEVATAVNDLGNLLGSLGEYTEARPLLERAMILRERSLGPNHPALGRSLAGLANTYRATGDLQQARTLHERALAITEAAYGPDHPQVASRVGDLGNVFANLGDLTRARALHERALAITEKVSGPTHVEMASKLNNLASTELEAGELDRARALYERSLAIWEKSLGPDHPNIAVVLGNLAKIYHARDELDAAAPLFLRVLQIREKALGPDNPKVAAALTNVASVALKRKRYPEGLAYIERAMKIYDAHDGLLEGEPEARFNLAQALVETGGDRVRALAEAERARSEAEQLGPPKAVLRTQLVAWLAKHRP